jgi:hypothetical protein
MPSRKSMGKWSEELRRFVHEVHAINTDEQLTSEHASSLFETAKRNLAEKGFVYYRRRTAQSADS